MIELEKPQGAAADEIGLLGRLTETGWVPPRTMSFPECGAELRAIRRCHHGVLFGIGDVLNYAERKWGETYAQLASDSGYNAQFLMNCKWVAAKFPVHDRVPGLSFSHHQVVAGLPLEQARALLVIAGAEEWSKDYLRRRIKQLRSPRAVESGVESHSGIRIGGSCLIDSLGDEQVVGRAKQIRSLPKLYDVLYADPPWRDESRFLDSMPTAGICALPVEDIAGDDAMLFLWARPGMLADALQVIKAWGFHY